MVGYFEDGPNLVTMAMKAQILSLSAPSVIS
jgi:hypothetical protein